MATELRETILDDVEEHYPEMADAVADLLAEDETTIHVDDNADSDYMRSTRERGAVAVSQYWERTVTLTSPADQWEITFSYPLEHNTVHGDDGGVDETQHPLLIGIEELREDHGYECPCCGTPFAGDKWEFVTGAGDRAGAISVYDCPTNDCTGTARVLV